MTCKTFREFVIDDKWQLKKIPASERPFILTSHINSDNVPSIVSLRRTSLPSNGPNHVPAGIFFNEHAPNLAPGILEMHKATPSGSFIFLSIVVSSCLNFAAFNSLLLFISLYAPGGSLSATEEIYMIYKIALNLQSFYSQFKWKFSCHKVL